MELRFEDLTLRREKRYFVIALLLSAIGWAILCVTIIGIPIVLGFMLLVWLTNGLLVAYLRSECVRIEENQLPALYGAFKDTCEKLKLKNTPQIYILQAGGFLNAFVMRHCRRNFVVVFSELLEAYGQDSDEIRFLIGHEVGHITSGHILKNIFLFPGLIFPLLGPAYRRATEASCDRYGAYASRTLEGAIRAMMVLSGGKEVGKILNAVSFAEQAKQQRGFFVSWHELISGYPTLSQRVAYLLALKDGSEVRFRRNPLAYLFAIFSFGSMEGTGSNLMITVAIVAFLAAIAIPNLLKARMDANNAQALAVITSMRQAVLAYASTHDNQYPSQIRDLKDAALGSVAENYCGKTASGYRYECTFLQSDFEFNANPAEPGVTGSKVYRANKDKISQESVRRQEYTKGDVP